jgi:polyhydroxyalkanoate synthesis regulator phasin
MPLLKDKRALSDVLRETWMSALGVLSSAESEVSRLTARIVEILGRPREEAQHLAHELQSHIRGNRAALERRVEEAVRSAADRLLGSLASEVAQLRRRVEELQGRIDEQARRRG